MNNEDAVKPKKTMSPEARAKISARMKQFYKDHPEKHWKGGRRSKKASNTRRVPLDSIRDVPEKKARKTYTKREKKIVVGDEVKLEVLKLLNKLL
jgi:hypothetical protein